MNSERNNAIVRTGAAGIGANLLLAALKLAVGIAANSVAIITDAVNNIGDAMTYTITVVGTRLSEKEPDRKHPFGYGRTEYLTTLIIGVAILCAGIEALKTSVERILNPEPSDYAAVTLIIVSAALLVKILIGLYTKKRGRALDSHALTVSGNGALHDAIASAATLVAAIVYIRTGYNIEAWIGAAISVIIIKEGVDTMRETAGVILGKSTDVSLASAVKKSILDFPEVDGVYDIVIHSYGRERLMGSAHIEVTDRLTVAWIDNLQRAITRKVKADTGVEMLGLSIYAINSRSERVIKARETVRAISLATPGVRQMHGFYIDRVDKTMSFDVVVDFDVKDKSALRDDITRKVLEAYPEYDVKITVDNDFTDE